MMGAIKLRNIVKKAIIKRGGMLSGYDVVAIMEEYGVHASDIQNAINYFQFSPQQEKFGHKYGLR